MTVYKLALKPERYIGDTSDDKPTNVPVGSTYFDRETGIMYICYDGTNWAIFNNTNVSGG